jgi:hypothetical protein
MDAKKAMVEEMRARALGESLSKTALSIREVAVVGQYEGSVLHDLMTVRTGFQQPPNNTG